MKEIEFLGMSDLESPSVFYKYYILFIPFPNVISFEEHAYTSIPRT